MSTRIILAIIALSLVAGCTGNGGEPPALDNSLSQAQLASATYSGVYDDSVTLVDGHWQGEPFIPEGASRPTVMLLEMPPCYVDMDGEPADEAAVLLVENSGGSGSFVYLAVVGIGDGVPLNLGTVLLGDRVQVRSMNGFENQLILDLLEFGPEDAMCCPTRLTSRIYGLGTDGLKLIETKEQGTLHLE